MPDQAEKLRDRIRETSTVSAAQRPVFSTRSPNAPRSLLFTSGKGGVGTSNLVLNLSIALAGMGRRVVVVDADLGLANLDLLCGLTPTVDLGDILEQDGNILDALIDGPQGIRLLPGAHGLRSRLDFLPDGLNRVVEALAGVDGQADFLMIDAGSGLGPAIATLAASVDEVVVVTTPEPTSVADAHAAISRFRRLDKPPMLRLLVNQVRSASEAVEVSSRIISTSQQFQRAFMTPLGYVAFDAKVPAAVRRRRPFIEAFPYSTAARGVRRLARCLLEESDLLPRRPGPLAALALVMRGGRPPECIARSAPRPNHHSAAKTP